MTGSRPHTHAIPYARACLSAVVSLSLACERIPDSGDAADPVVETHTIGDTTVVRTVSGSVWGGDATLVPETAIGELDGPDEYLFGSVRSIAVDDDHNVYVLDGQARHVRAYDSEGTYLRTLGRDGEGPGEFKVPIGLAISEGRLLVRDPANGRVQLFALETGENEEWRYLPSDYFMNTPLYRDDHGRIYVDISDPQVHFIVMDSDGTQLDTISPPAAPVDFDDDKYSMSDVSESGDQWMSVGATVPFSPNCTGRSTLPATSCRPCQPRTESTSSGRVACCALRGTTHRWRCWTMNATAMNGGSWTGCARSMQGGAGTVPPFRTTSRRSGALPPEATAGSG